jgi:hypothetical protein
MQTTNNIRYTLCTTKLQQGSTYNQETHDLWDGQTVSASEVEGVSPLQALLDMVRDNRTSDEDEEMIVRIRAAIAAGERHSLTDQDGDGWYYSWEPREDSEAE